MASVTARSPNGTLLVLTLTEAHTVPALSLHFAHPSAHSAHCHMLRAGKFMHMMRPHAFFERWCGVTAVPYALPEFIWYELIYAGKGHSRGVAGRGRE